MWQLEPPGAPDDVARYCAALAGASDFFDTSAPVVIARAPGRLDLMGGIADYSGSLVLELPLALATVAGAQIDARRMITVRSASASELGVPSEVAVALDDLAPGGRALSYADARQLFAADGARHWAAYVIGVLVVLAHERGLVLDQGLRVLVRSDVPAGKGVSSSAAIEVVSMRALAELLGVTIDGRDLAILCQMVENLVVGAPCGVMDQMTSANGEADALLALLCQPAEIQGNVRLPADLEVWGIDSGIRHAVSGADYGSVRVGAFMGYRIIADLAGLAHRQAGGGLIEVDDPAWRGYLANIPPSLWETRFRDRLPQSITGAAFLERYGGFTDSVTRIEPARTYAVRTPTAHPIYEHQRVQLFRALLQADDGAHVGDGPHVLLGELMYQSHASYGACGLGSEGTDRLVELVRAAGPAHGLYGAKITGGGSGGTVAVLARRGSEQDVRDVAAHYTAKSGRAALVIGGSSPGAVASGTWRATLAS
jgi:L-arabinokinase